MLLTGSAGGGKSTLAAEKVHAFCLRYPGAVAIGLRKKREYASKSVVYALRTAQGDDPNVTWRPSDQMFHYANGSKIFIAGMGDDNQRQALRSINGDGSADIIWGEEANALTEDDHNELMARLRGTSAPWRDHILDQSRRADALDKAPVDGWRRGDGLLQQRQRQYTQP